MLENNDPQIGEIISLVGGITVTWALLESALDICIDRLFFVWGANAVVTEIPRTAMNRKITFLREVFKPDVLITTLFPTMGNIIDRIEHLSEQRHHMIHGVASLVFADDGSIEVKRLFRSKAGLMAAVATVRPADLEALIHDIHTLATFLAEFAAILSKTENDGDEASRKAPV